MKKRSILATLPAVFSLNAKSNYSRFLVRDGAAGMMRDAWAGIGRRLDGATRQVGKEADGQAKKPEAT